MIKIKKMTKDSQSCPLNASDVKGSVNFPGGKLLSCTLLFAIATANASAQQPSEDVEEITVTGSRVIRDGFQAPTPVTVLGGEMIGDMGVTVISDAVNRLPALSGSVTSRNSATEISGGTGGINTLSLRGFGPNRTLTLLDGKRMVTSSFRNRNSNSGAVDTNEFPSGLIERVEVVTGGASAAYGSDALAGVVNFILDKDYTGVKANAQMGITTHGDGQNSLVSFTAGMPFADGRGHFSFSVDSSRQDPIPSVDRSWAKDNAFHLIRNPNHTPSNGQPQLLTVQNAGPAVTTPGGLIVGCSPTSGGACPLRGTQFLQGGVPGPFEFGSLISGIMMVGGDFQQSRINTEMSLSQELNRDIGYSHIRYDINDSITAYGTLHLARTEGINHASAPNFAFGNVKVLSGNPFIPASVQAQMTASGIPSFALGSTNTDVPNFGSDNDRSLDRYEIGLEGKFDAFGSSWLWDAYYTKSDRNNIERSTNNMNVKNYHTAIDAVVDNGRIVCRINADGDLANNDSACIPYNPMGKGVNDQLAVDYVVGQGRADTAYEQEVVAFNASGDPFSTWAGPVSVAFGLEYRKEELDSVGSDLDNARRFLVANYSTTKGEFDVTEGYVETVIPLANDLPFARVLDLNLAARLTDYSTSGNATTWKLGVNWAITDDVRFRFTRSRDIRAAAMGELFDAGLFGAATPLNDPFSGESRPVASLTTGNPNLNPEEADTTGLGVVYTPSFLPGFAASVDYYDIDINGAIATLGRDGVVNQCFGGNQVLCPSIDFDANGGVQFVRVQPVNVNSQLTNGLDIEISYGFPLSNISSSLSGDLSFRALATIVDSLETEDVTGIVTEGAGVNHDSMGTGAGFSVFGPDFSYLNSATYRNQSFSATLSMRGIGSGVYSNSYIECDLACPAPVLGMQTINDNSIDSVEYFDLSLSYSVNEAVEVFFVAENFLDEAPPLAAGNSPWNTGNQRFYDTLGRMYIAGVRANF